MKDPDLLLFIIDREVEFIFSKYKSVHKFILDIKDWESFPKNDLGQYTAIVVLPELAWNTKNQTEDLGIWIGLDIRRKYRCLSPIILVSSLSLSYFETRARKAYNYNLIFARGTTYLSILETEKLEIVIDDVSPISLSVLTDMNEMLFNLKGVLSDTLGHRLRPGMGVEACQNLLLEMGSLLNEEQFSVIDWEQHTNFLIENLGNEPVFLIGKSTLLEKIDKKVSHKLSNADTLSSEKRHTLLLVEDDESFAKEARFQLEKYFNQVIWTDDAEKAIQLLNEDETNSIVGLLCDWRLYKIGSTKYWQMQGYEVLAYAAQNHFSALFGVTSLSETNVHSIRNMLGFEVHLFKKEQLLSGETSQKWQMMADLMLQKCDGVVEIIASQPSASSWLVLKKEYQHKRQSDWFSFESEISLEASRLFSFFRDAIENDNARNVFSVSEMGISLKGNLKSTLIVRRIFMGLYFLLNKRNLYLQEIRPASLLGDSEKVDTGLRHHGIDAYSILRKDWWDDIQVGTESVRVQTEWDKFDQRTKNFRNVLCIDISELPKKGLLPEEKAWMNKNGIDFSFLFNFWEDEF